MAFKATLIMDQQKTSAAEVEAYNGGLIKFVMPAQGDDDLFFYNWMFNRAETHDGTIEMLLSTDDNQKKYLHLYFEDAYMVNMYQYFNNSNSLLVRTKVTLSARRFTFGGSAKSANFENDWIMK